MIRRQIPNLITLGNLLCGVIACYDAVRGDDLSLAHASLFICLGIFLDFFDGLAARLLNVASPFGKELDSLADVVTSGVAPSFILIGMIRLSNLCQEWTSILSVIALLIPLFAAYRLAKFNIDSRQSHSFLGLPVPANALIWVGLALSIDHSYCAETGEISDLIYGNYPGFFVALAAISLVTDVLMVSEMPMFSLKFNFKDMSWKSNSVQYIFLIGCAVIIAVTRQWYAISLIILWYIILSAITQKKHAE